MYKFIVFFAVTFLLLKEAASQVQYPYPLKYVNLVIESRQVQMAYMDVRPPDSTTKKTVLLLHGKNFNGYYWKGVIPLLTAAGYRVIIPDQVGWGKSDRSNLHYSFHLLANNTKLLLQSEGVNKVVVLGHSMGGMLAIRFALMFPQLTEKLILENPIGLEDYKTFVPYQTIDSLIKKEQSATYESYKKYQQSYYPIWQPQYEQYVAAQTADLRRADIDSIAYVNAITYQMIYEQPVCYELDRISVPTLLVIGQADRTVVGKDKLSDTDKKIYGNYPLLGKLARQKIKGSVLKPLDAVGHIPHIQNLDLFWAAITDWIK